MDKTHSFFSNRLLSWYQPDSRPLAWKHIDNPYYIWLSEIILQQTRAEQGAAYFNKFIRRYPIIGDLAKAPEDEVMKMWEGLGYYSRARNLHATAKYIQGELGGTFPSSYQEILGLRGVGPYTAAAIASFAFKLPYAVVDGNVYRVLSRFFDEASPIDTTVGKKQFAALAQQLLDTRRPDIYNQAIMDFGATVCKPKTPNCHSCPLVDSCLGFANNTIGERPVKTKKLKRKERYFNYLVIRSSEQSIIEKRVGKDIWRNLYQFPLIETTGSIGEWAQLLEEQWPEWMSKQKVELLAKRGPYKQELTHRRIIATFWELEYSLDKLVELPEHINIVKPEKWFNFAFPKVISCYFDDNSLLLF